MWWAGISGAERAGEGRLRPRCRIFFRKKGIRGGALRRVTWEFQEAGSKRQGARRGGYGSGGGRGAGPRSAAAAAAGRGGRRERQGRPGVRGGGPRALPARKGPAAVPGEGPGAGPARVPRAGGGLRADGRQRGLRAPLAAAAGRRVRRGGGPDPVAGRDVAAGGQDDGPRRGPPRLWGGRRIPSRLPHGDGGRARRGPAPQADIWSAPRPGDGVLRRAEVGRPRQPAHRRHRPDAGGPRPGAPSGPTEPASRTDERSHTIHPSLPSPEHQRGLGRAVQGRYLRRADGRDLGRTHGHRPRIDRRAGGRLRAVHDGHRDDQQTVSGREQSGTRGCAGREG